MNPELETRRALARITDRGGKILMGCYRGSVVHNLHRAAEDGGIDDTDLAAVFAYPLRYYVGLESYARSKRKETVDTGGADCPVDVAAHDLRKFVSLLCKGNPSVHLWLWVPERFRYLTSPAADYLISLREAFLSQRNIDATAGYVRAQIARMESGAHKGYMGERRKALVDQHGYDVKNAAHCVRLLLQGVHLLEHRRILVELEGEDRARVLAVKRGEVGLADLRSMASSLWSEFRKAEEQHRDSFPERVDPKKADRALWEAHMSAETFASIGVVIPEDKAR